MNVDYMVSVRLMTYNHAIYIEEAMQSIFMQETSFRIEIVIGDDFSTDGTLDIIRRYEDTENIHIKILERKKGEEYFQNRRKIGRLYNFYNILENCGGKYIALLDGDDYWTDPLKLQKQVDFLEGHPDCGLVHGDCNFLDIRSGKFLKSANKKLGVNFEYGTRDELFDLLVDASYKIRTATVVFKKEVLNSIKSDFDELYSKFLMLDTPLWLLMSQKTRFHYFDNVFAVYRISKSSVSRPNESHNKARFQLSKLEMRIFFLNKFKKPIPKKIADDYNKSLLEYKSFNQNYVERYPLLNPSATETLLLNNVNFYFVRKIIRYSYAISRISKIINMKWVKSKIAL